MPKCSIMVGISFSTIVVGCRRCSQYVPMYCMRPSHDSDKFPWFGTLTTPKLRWSKWSPFACGQFIMPPMSFSRSPVTIMHFFLGLSVSPTYMTLPKIVLGVLVQYSCAHSFVSTFLYNFLKNIDILPNNLYTLKVIIICPALLPRKLPMRHKWYWLWEGVA